MKYPIDRRLAMDTYVALSDHGFVRGATVVSNGSNVIVSLEIPKNVDRMNLMALLRKNIPELPSASVEAIEATLEQTTDGDLALNIPFKTEAIAFDFHVWANASPTG